MSHDSAVDAITSAPEFRALRRHLEPFVNDGSGANDMRTALNQFAKAAWARRWSTEAIVKALHATGCYQGMGTRPDTRAQSRRYNEAIDFLLYGYFNG